MIDELAASPALLLVVFALAVYRVTRFLVHDTILGEWPTLDAETGEPLDYVLDDDGNPAPNRGTGLRYLFDLLVYDDDGDARGPVRHWLGKLATCTYCVSVWVTAAVIPLWYHGGEAGEWFVIGAAVAGAAGYLAGRPGA